MLLVALVGVAAGIGLRGPGSEPGAAAPSAAAEQLYTCGMHPQVIQNHPGNCPICGMKLTPIRKQEAIAPGVAEEGNVISVSPETVQKMNLRTALVTRGPLRRTIRTVGVVDYDETALADVTTKFKGWIEKLYVDATGQQVHKGDPLFDIYSPELYVAQSEYLLAMEASTNGAADGGSLRASARTRLSFFDVSNDQVAELERTGKPGKTVRILAPRDGFAIEKNVVEGQMVDVGVRTYRLADIGLVWVQAQIYEQDLPYVKLGQEAAMTLSYLPDREFRGRVTYVYPNMDEKTRTARIRLEFHNPGYLLKPGMFATITATCELEPSALLIPGMAVLRSGERCTVFVALEGGKFEPRTVTLGPQAGDDRYQVLEGLAEGERIVTSGQFMLDSESQLREAIQKMRGQGAVTLAHAEEKITPPSGGGAARTASSNAASAVVKYICPMPEHVSIEYLHPGKCPLCGMTLVPVSEEALRAMPPGGTLLYYTCPMPEHGSVKAEKPGKCPLCGMTLIPVMSAPR